MLPDWFEDNFVDMERLFIDMFETLLPNFTVGRWTPDDWLNNADPEPELTIARLPGGKVCYDEFYDEASIQFSATTNDPDESHRTISLVRAVLLPMQGFKWRMGDGYTAMIRGAVEAVGQQLLTPGQMADERVVPVTLRIKVGMRDRTRYDAKLRELNIS